MYIIMLILITFASTADSFIIGFNYGLKKVRINRISNLYISGVTCLGTFLSMHLGRLFGEFLSPSEANMIGGSILIALAMYMAITTFCPKENKLQDITKDPSSIDEDKSFVIELREALFVGVLLSINNVGMGIGAGITGMPVFITPLICGIASFIFISTGSKLGYLLHNQRLSKYLEVLSAILVLILGILGFYN